MPRNPTAPPIAHTRAALDGRRAWQWRLGFVSPGLGPDRAAWDASLAETVIAWIRSSFYVDSGARRATMRRFWTRIRFSFGLALQFMDKPTRLLFRQAFDLLQGLADAVGQWLHAEMLINQG